MNEKQSRFVAEYLIDLNATQAAIRAGYSERTAYSHGQRLLKDVEVQAAIKVEQDKRAERTEITADRVLAELWEIASADPNELVQYRIGPCDACWPDDAKPLKTRAPNPDCVACGGEGWGRPHVVDTRALGPKARKLYAGVKVTKAGLEVKMHDRLAALVHVGKHLGMFIDKVEHSGEVATEIIDRPPGETREEWIARRKREMGQA